MADVLMPGTQSQGMLRRLLLLFRDSNRRSVFLPCKGSIGSGFGTMTVNEKIGNVKILVVRLSGKKEEISNQEGAPDDQ
jgi:hypothetical protein